MNDVNKTLYIPLYGKAYVSRRGLFLKDEKAEEIWAAEGFALKGRSRSKWLAYYMGVRSAVFDEWLMRKMDEMPEAAIIHIGCGMDSRILRVGTGGHRWYDVDFPEVIEQRCRYYSESDGYEMIAADASEATWPDRIAARSAIIVMEGVSMYLSNDEMQGLMKNLCGHFDEIALLMDCYSTLAAKMSKYKNPINDVGVTKVYGTDDPRSFENGGLDFVAERLIVPQKYVDQLHGIERRIFAKLYAGGFSRKLYRLFEYEKK